MKESDIKRLVEEYLIPGVMVQVAEKNEEMLVYVREIKKRLDDLEAHKHDHPFEKIVGGGYGIPGFEQGEEMTKTYCDICKSEITSNQHNSPLSFEIDRGGNKPVFRIKFEDTCDGCRVGVTIAINDYLEKRKR